MLSVLTCKTTDKYAETYKEGTSVHIPVDDAGTVPAGTTVLNVLSSPIGMSSVEKHGDDISGVKE